MLLERPGDELLALVGSTVEILIVGYEAVNIHHLDVWLSVLFVCHNSCKFFQSAVALVKAASRLRLNAKIM